MSSTDKNVYYWLSTILIFFLATWIVTYYLSSVSRINTYPTYLIAITLIAILGTSEGQRLVPNNRMLLFVIGLFLLYLTGSTLWSIDSTDVSGIKYFGYALLTFSFVVSIAIIFRQHPKEAHWLLVLIVLSAFVSATYSIHLHFALPEYKPLVEDRLYALGKMHSPTLSAYSYSLALILLLHIGISSPSLTHRIFWICLSFPLIAAIMLTGTRSIVLALIIALIIVCLANPSWKKRTKFNWLLCILFLLATSTTLILHSDYAELITRRSLSFRPEIWGTVLEKFENANWYRWLFGYGVASNESIVYQGHYFDHPHNLHIATFYYGGATGVVFLESIIVMTLLHVIRRPHHPLQLACLGLLTFSSTLLLLDGNRILEKSNIVWLLFWLPVALAISLHDNPDSNLQEERGVFPWQPCPN